MIKRALRLSLGVTLIIAASAVLLLTDRGGQRVGLGSPVSSAAGPQRVFSVALLQHISQPILEEGANGMIAALAAAGYRDGGTIRLRRFNAEGDAATSNTIARELVGGDYDLIITLSTPSLQAVAGANRDAKVPHVFGMVSDPVAAGVGIARDDPDEASALHGRPRHDAAGGRGFPHGPPARPQAGAGRRRLEPVGGQFRGVHQGRPSRLQGAGDRAARGERRELGGRSRGGCRRSSAGGPRRSGSAATSPCSPRSSR